MSPQPGTRDREKGAERENTQNCAKCRTFGNSHFSLLLHEKCRQHYETAGSRNRKCHTQNRHSRYRTVRTSAELTRKGEANSEPRVPTGRTSRCPVCCKNVTCCRFREYKVVDYKR